MGVTYKLREEVVSFIISQRQGNPLASCRQLAESASQKFSLKLSKSSVHDVLKESGIVTPRGRKPKDKFEIPQEKKKQIQVSLSKSVILSPPSVIPSPSSVILNPSSVILSEAKDLKAPKDSSATPQNDVEAPSALSVVPNPSSVIPNPSSVILSEAKDLKAPKDSSPVGLRMTSNEKEAVEISPEYEGAGRIFLKAALWDLGVFSEENIKKTDWDYYLTYSKGIKVVLEDNKSFFIDLPLPLERCIRETADGLINNVKPLIVHKVSDEELFKACMDPKTGFNIKNVSIVEQNDHILFEFSGLMEFERKYELRNRIFMENKDVSVLGRAKTMFFPQIIDNNDVMENILNLKGFDTTNNDENVVSILIGSNYDNKPVLQEAVEKLNGMCLRDEQNRLVSVRIEQKIGTDTNFFKRN